MNLRLYKSGDLLCESGEIDLEDAILTSLGEFVFRASRAFGEKTFVVKVPSGVSIEVDRPEEAPSASFEDRIRLIIESCEGICGRVEAPYCFVAPRMFALDGWTWNVSVFRSPIWMNDHRDVPIDDARKIDGLQWLSGSSSEIRFEPKGA